MKKSILFILAAAFGLLLISTSIAQISPQKGNSDFYSNLSGSGFSLLDPSRLSISNSYSFSYFSGNGQSGSVGMLMNSIEYQISNPLKVTLNLGVMHNPSAFIGQSSGGLSPIFLPGVKIQYRPNDNFLFQMNFQSYPSRYFNNYYNSGYGRGSSFFWNH